MKTISSIFILPLIVTTNGDDSSSKRHSPCLPGSNEAENRVIEKAVVDLPAITGTSIPCVRNNAAGYPCSNTSLESFLPLSDLTGGLSAKGNDIWGWTSPGTGIEYALVGLSTGTSFVSLKDPNNPKVLGFLDTHTDDSSWRDIKTCGNYTFIVSEAISHGMQVFDLTILDETESFTFFRESAHYDEISSAHNIAVNEESSFAYIVGAEGNIDCNQGLHIVDINDPLNPTFSGCFSEKGYTHDVQCVIYDGPDTSYTGKEICFASNESEVDIIDVTEKSNPTLISTFQYEGYEYVHQGWLTEDKHYFIIDDEADEIYSSQRTRSIICDVSDLSFPRLHGIYEAPNAAIDHNMYVKGNYVYQANYRAGLRVLDLSSISKGDMKEIAYFDVYPDNDSNRFSGAWSNFPYFESGLIIVNSIERGLFVVRVGCNPGILFEIFFQLRFFLETIFNV